MRIPQHPGPAVLPPRDLLRLALADALGFPALILLASMTGFGSLARESGLGLGVALSATAGIWGLPGQIALAEFHAHDDPANNSHISPSCQLVAEPAERSAAT